jgi:hypothetical protein
MSVVKGLPQELKPDFVSLPESVSSYSVKVVSQNVTSVVSSTLNVAAGKTSGQVIQVTMPSTQINFDIPCNQNKNTWIDTSKSTISFRAIYKRVEGGTAMNNSMDAALIHNAYNFFNRIFHVSSTGSIIDDVPLSNLAVTNFLQQNISAQEMDCLSLPYGFNNESAIGATSSTNANTGHSIALWSAASTGTKYEYHSYELPLPSSVIGSFARAMFPIGSVSKLTLSLVTDSIAPVCIAFDTTSTGSADLSITLSDFAINLQYVDLGEAGSALLGGSGPKICSGITHRVSSTTLNSGVSGAVSQLLGIRGSSVRSLTCRVSEGVVSTAGSANDKFDSKMPLATNINFYLGGKDRIPPNPLSPLTAPASVYMRALQASNAFNERQYKMSSTPQSFCVYTATSGDLTTIEKEYNVSSSTTAYNSLATFMFAMPLQKVSKSKILDGYNFNNSNQYCELTLLTGSTNNLIFYFIAELDVIYIINDGDIQVRI